MQLYSERVVPSTADPQVEAPPAPFNLDIEQAVLGALMLGNDSLDELSFLGFEHFFDQLHQSIFAAICRMAKAGRRADGLTLGREFANAVPVGDQTVVQYLGSLASKAATRRQLRAYAQSIVDLAVRRWLILAGEDLAQDARESALDVSPKTLIEETEQRLFALAEKNAPETSTILTFSQAMAEAIEDANNAYKHKSSGLKTHIPSVDAKLGGMQQTDLLILAGRPGMGKTALAANIAFNVAYHGDVGVAFFSLEMSAKQLALRVLSERVDISSSKFRTGKVSEDEIKKLICEASNLSNLPLFTDQLGGATVAQIVARARRLKRKHNIGLIVIDYLQLMQASRRRENRVQDITEITTGLKALAKELQVPVLALSQLSRETEKRENKRPQLSDLRESGSIEQDADVVLFVYREEYYLDRQAPSATDPMYAEWQTKLAACMGKAEVIIGKQRHGETGTVQLAFSGELTRFSDLATTPRQEARHGL